jgi:antitoxin component YwqK of YwqJK toxin-antitoxin module
MNKPFLYSLIALFLSVNLWAQTEINQLDAQGKRHGIWKKLYQNGNLRYIGQFEHGKEVGTFKFYPITGEKHPMVIKKFNKTTDLATVEYYSTKGVLESTGQMSGKKRIGQWTYFFADGKTVMSIENYKDGLLDGELKIFYKSGKLTELSHYKNGKKHGNSLRYSDEGVLMENLTYKDGVIHGPAVIYDEKGEVFARGSYENGIKAGIWEFNMDGEMVKFDPSKKAKTTDK